MPAAKQQIDAKHLKSLVAAVSCHLSEIDRLMKGPTTPERGRDIACLCNALEMENDKARYFGLGIDWRTDRKKK